MTRLEGFDVWDIDWVDLDEADAPLTRGRDEDLSESSAPVSAAGSPNPAQPRNATSPDSSA
jgi:hypothetical protein